MGGRSTYERLEFPELWDDIVATSKIRIPGNSEKGL